MTRPRSLLAMVTLCGLGGCLFLAFWVDIEVWVLGLTLIGLGLLWQRWMLYLQR